MKPRGIGPLYVPLYAARSWFEALEAVERAQRRYLLMAMSTVVRPRRLAAATHALIEAMDVRDAAVARAERWRKRLDAWCDAHDGPPRIVWSSP